MKMTGECILFCYSKDNCYCRSARVKARLLEGLGRAGAGGLILDSDMEDSPIKYTLGFVSLRGGGLNLLSPPSLPYQSYVVIIMYVLLQSYFTSSTLSKVTFLSGIFVILVSITTNSMLLII